MGAGASNLMTLKRGIAAWAAAFLISQVLAVVVHGILLAADYKPFYGSLLRPMDGTSDWHIALLPLTHVFYVAGLVWLYPRAATNGTALERGLKVGLMGYVIGQLPQ